jgi:hypothetical protein
MGVLAIHGALDARETLVSLRFPIDVTEPSTLAGAQCLGRPLGGLTIGLESLTVLAFRAIRELDVA